MPSGTSAGTIGATHAEHMIPDAFEETTVNDTTDLGTVGRHMDGRAGPSDAGSGDPVQR